MQTMTLIRAESLPTRWIASAVRGMAIPALRLPRSRAASTALGTTAGLVSVTVRAWRGGVPALGRRS